jgi:hypothetical protein
LRQARGIATRRTRSRRRKTTTAHENLHDGRHETDGKENRAPHEGDARATNIIDTQKKIIEKQQKKQEKRRQKKTKKQQQKKTARA